MFEYLVLHCDTYELERMLNLYASKRWRCVTITQEDNRISVVMERFKGPVV